MNDLNKFFKETYADAFDRFFNDYGFEFKNKQLSYWHLDEQDIIILELE